MTDSSPVAEIKSTPKKEAPADLFRQLNRTERRRVPPYVSAEMVKDSAVCFRASSRLAEIDDDGKQVKNEDGSIKMHLFSPADEVPLWVIEHYNFSGLIAQGRIYCNPLPVNAPRKEIKKETPIVEVKNELISEEVIQKDLTSLRLLKDTASKRDLKDAFIEAGIEFSNAASKKELFARREDVLAGE